MYLAVFAECGGGSYHVHMFSCSASGLCYPTCVQCDCVNVCSCVCAMQPIELICKSITKCRFRLSSELVGAGSASESALLVDVE